MIIKSMTASFGRLEDETLELKPGLNVVTMPNESGKSSWCAFIRAMLYGIDTSERAKNGYLPDKLRYQPWSGKPMSGSMDIEFEGRAVTLTRQTKTASAPMREFRAVYSGTAEPVKGMTGAAAGEMLTGAGKEVFRRSAFIGQGEAAVTGTAELERRIAAIVSTGEEGTSCTEALARLKGWQNRRRSRNRSGAIPELEAELDVAGKRLEEITDADSRRSELGRELERASEEAAALSSGLEKKRAAEREAARRDFDNATHDIARLEALSERTASGYEERLAELHASAFFGMSAEEAEAKASEALERARELRQSSELPERGRWQYIALGVLLAACAALSFWSVYALAGAAAALGLLAWKLASGKKAAKTASDAARERMRVLDSVGAGSEEELRQNLEKYIDLCARARKDEDSLKDLGRRLADSRRAQHEAEARLFEQPGKAVEVARAEQRCERLRTAIAELSGKIAATGDPMALRSGLLEKRERLAALEAQYEAISLASETLRQADAELQSRFSPELGRRAAEYLSRLSGGRYTSVAVAKDFSVLLRQEGESAQREAIYLSAGASDLMYLSVRLAIVDLTLPADEPCPLILDDALVNLDTERRARVLELLGEIAEKRQVILFTCT